jgi:hypothetical protein
MWAVDDEFKDTESMGAYLFAGWRLRAPEPSGNRAGGFSASEPATHWVCN